MQQTPSKQEQFKTFTYTYLHGFYGVVPKGLLTFLGSLYTEVAKITPGTLVYRFERQTARKKKSFEKHCVLDLECRILPQESSDNYSLYFNGHISWKVS